MIGVKTQYNQDLLISEVQKEDEGVYQCIVSNSVGETSASSTLKVIDNLSYSPQNFYGIVDHLNGRIKLSWNMMDNKSIRQYFVLTYYLTDDGISNSIVLDDVRCATSNYHCTASCCRSFVLEPHNNYTFQLAVVGTAIGPLSDALTLVTWDAVVKKPAQLQLIGGQNNTLLLEWKTIPDLPGEVTEFKIEQFEEVSRRIKVFSLPSDAYSTVIEELKPNLTYFYRVVPRTRAGYPSEFALNNPERFPWLSYTVPVNNNSTRSAAPEIISIQEDHNSWKIDWRMNQSENVRKLRLSWRIVSSGPLDEHENLKVAVRGDRGSFSIKNNVIHGESYQLVLVGLDEYDQIISFSSTKLFSGDYIKIETEMSEGGPVKPRPVLCKPDTCSCVWKGNERVLVSWSRPFNSRGIFGNSEYQLKYSLNNEAVGEIKTIQSKTESVLVEGLQLNKTYRMEIQTSNHYDNSPGQSFICKTPTFPPPPSDIHWIQRNMSAFELSWKSVSDGNWSYPIGYVIYLRKEKRNKAREILVDGISTTRMILNLLSSHQFYVVSMATRSSIGVGIASDIVIIKIGSNFTRFDRSVIHGVVFGMAILMLLCLLVICALVRCKRRKRHSSHQRKCNFEKLWNCCRRESEIQSHCETESSISSDLKSERCWKFCFSNRSSKKRQSKVSGQLPSGGALLIDDCVNNWDGQNLELSSLVHNHGTVAENDVNSDYTGGENGTQPSCQHFRHPQNEMQNFQAVKTLNGMQKELTINLKRKDIELQPLVSHATSTANQPEATDLNSNRTHPPPGDITSDLGHSPVTTISLQSWSHEGNDRLSQHACCSLPNMTDSGFGFDDQHGFRGHINARKCIAIRLNGFSRSFTEQSMSARTSN